MTDSEKLALIRDSGQFDSWVDSQLRRVLPFFDEVAVCAREGIAVEGTPCHQFFVVADGMLETFCGDRAEILRVGDSFGWAAMERRATNRATVIALTDARLLVMSHAQFRAAAAPPPRRRFLRWALPTSRRSLPRPPDLVASVDVKKARANPAG
ncbi:MAG TPA: cyclic nucleotide-binding domain-containing protein [Candidatus Dormibacteraeota bacterium]|nr:cyclic nucleotide-binding domain-containing protein [Candidatus Dormibacteraeota bacterium]